MKKEQLSIVKDKEYLGYLILEDEIKEDVKETIKNFTCFKY